MVNLLFPIETTARELDGKILMAVLAASKNRRVFIGDQQIIRTLSFFLKGGVFYGKHLFGKPMFSDTKYYRRLKKNNFSVIHLNEEGAIWPGKEGTWEYLLKQAERPSVLDKDDYMAVWGQWQKEFNSSYESPTVNIIVTGHPRFDLYSKKYRPYFERETKALIKKYGDYILVNTAFSYANNGEGGVGFIFKQTLSYDVSNTLHREYRFKRWRFQILAMSDLVSLVNEISIRFPKKQIIFRPHPSENSEYYKQIFQKIKNIHVVYEGAVTPWILGCKLLLHNGCTTAIESTLAGKPVINYSTNFDAEFDTYIANICGQTINDPLEVMKYIEEVYNNNTEVIVPNDEKANGLFYNFQCQDTSRMVLPLFELAENRIKIGRSKNRGIVFIRIVGIIHKIYLFAKFFYYLIQGNIKKHFDYRKRCVRFSKNDILFRVQEMSKILGVEVNVKYINEYLFIIDKK